MNAPARTLAWLIVVALTAGLATAPRMVLGAPEGPSEVAAASLTTAPAQPEVRARTETREARQGATSGSGIGSAILPRVTMIGLRRAAIALCAGAVPVAPASATTLARRARAPPSA